MKYKEGEPVVRNSASVLHTDIEITFLEKHQLDEIFPYLVENSLDFEFDTIYGDSINNYKYVLTIKDIPWANNVTRLFKQLEELDYNQGILNE